MPRAHALFATGFTTFLVGIALGAAVTASTTPVVHVPAPPPVTGPASQACLDARALAREVQLRAASNPDARAGAYARDDAEQAVAVACK